MVSAFRDFAVQNAAGVNVGLRSCGCSLSQFASQTAAGVNVWLRQAIHYLSLFRYAKQLPGQVFDYVKPLAILKWIGFWHLMPSPEVGV